MSVLGVAKELSAIYNRPLRFSPLEYNGEFKKNDFKVEIKDMIPVNIFNRRC
jgi:hypothetical protein